MRALVTYWTVDYGIWSPRDSQYGWKQYDTYETEGAAKKDIRKLLKEDPDGALLLTKCEVTEAWNKDKPPKWATPKEEEASDAAVD